MKAGYASRLVAGIAVGAAGTALLGAPGSAQAQNQIVIDKVLSPDLLQSLGVGSRSVAMGDAFTAIADDSSATFWNPARLSRINFKEFMLEYRSVVLSRVNISNLDKNGNILGSPSVDAGASQGRPQLGFGSIVYPMGKKLGGGVLGFSYTLGGYLNYERNTIAASDITNTRTEDLLTQTVRNQFFTLAYGNKLSKTLVNGSAAADKKPQKAPIVLKTELGIGGYYVNSSADSILNNQTFALNSGNLISSALVKQSDLGNGTGMIFGLTMQLSDGTGDLANDRPWRLGVTHRTGTHLDGLSSLGTSFSSAIPSRTSVGVAYESIFKKKPGASSDRTHTIVISAEAQQFSGANTPQQTDYRQEETNVHFGLEYGRPASRYFGKSVPDKDQIFVRAGFRTNQNAAKSYTYYENVASVGFAYVRRGSATGLQTLILEPTAEIFTKSGLVQWTFTGRARW